MEVEDLAVLSADVEEEGPFGRVWDDGVEGSARGRSAVGGSEMKNVSC